MPADPGAKHLERVRKIWTGMPEVTEKLSHGEPTFFVRKKVFTMFANNHHNDGHIAVWIPAPPSLQAMLIHQSPETYFKPPYVGGRGWVGIELGCINDQDLASHIRGTTLPCAGETTSVATDLALAVSISALLSASARFSASRLLISSFKRDSVWVATCSRVRDSVWATSNSRLDFSYVSRGVAPSAN